MAQDEKANAARPQVKLKKPGLDRSIQSHIGRKLKAIYHSFAAEPVPDRILELLHKLETEEQAKAAAAEAGSSHAQQPSKADGNTE
jgi:hypothetical protein